MSITMVTTKDHTYRNKRLTVGDKFKVVGESDKRLMIALGRAQIAPVEVAPPAPETVARPAWMGDDVPAVRRTYATKAVIAKDDAPKPAVKRAYHRRDMTAED